MEKIIKTLQQLLIIQGVIFLLYILFPQQVAGQTRDCQNAGLESNNFTNWTGMIGSYSGAGNLADINSGLILNNTALPAAQRITLINPGADPNVPIQRVQSGVVAIKLGSELRNGNAERVSYSIPITNNNKIFRYNYAVVLEIPRGENHTQGQLPFFSARVMVGKNVICQTGRKTAGVGDPFFQNQGDFAFRDWDCQVCDLTAYVGQTVTVEFTVASCSLGGHFGYAYIDGLCENTGINASFHLNKKSFCKNEQITLDGTAVVGETYYYLTLEESDANGGRPNPASEMILHFPNQTVGIENITSIFQSHGFVFQCNMYYRLKLAVGNACSSWNESVQVIFISCPPANAGRDICLDCREKDPRSFRIGDGNASPAYTYSWSPSIGLSNPNIAAPYHTQNSVNYPITYTLTVTDPRSGCTNTDQVTITCTLVEVELIKESTCCEYKISIPPPAYYTHTVWSNGAVNTDYILVTEPGTYSVTYSNSCSSTSASITITQEDIDKITRYHLNLNDNANQHFYASPSNQNSYNAFYIMNVEPNTPAYGEYKATHYKLEIYNRWGEMIRTIENEIQDCAGFPNPAIMWDGTVNGVNVPIDVYNGKLYLKNCMHTNWVHVKVDYCTEWGYTCLDWDCIFWLGSFDCGFMKKNVCVQLSDIHCTSQHREYTFPINIIF